MTHKDSLGRCMRCHSTLGRSAVTEAEQRINAQGVSCESCHGPGSRYSYYSIMRDNARFRANGGVRGSLKDCAGCHQNDPAHGNCPFTRPGFDAAAAWKQLRHPLRSARLVAPTYRR